MSCRSWVVRGGLGFRALLARLAWCVERRGIVKLRSRKTRRETLLIKGVKQIEKQKSRIRFCEGELLEGRLVLCSMLVPFFEHWNTKPSPADP